MATTLKRADPATVENASQRTGLQVRVRRTLTSEDGGFRLDVDFELQNGITILFGPSGAGKTTLLDCIAGLTDVNEGRIVVGARVLIDYENGINLSPTERNIGYVFQDLALFPHMTVEANVAYGLRDLKAEDRKQRVAGALEGLGLSDLHARRPAELSGGERQRVALARALVTQPSVLLLDEPLAALDMPVRMKIAEDLRRSVQALPIPVLYVTHSRDEVFMLGERMLMLERGKIIAEGTPHQVMSAPRSETVAQLAGFENVFDAEVISIHEERGTMTCKVTGSGLGRARLAAVPVNSQEGNGTTEVVPSRDDEPVGHLAQIELETPLVRAEVGSKLRVGISAGDVLLATSAPVGLSARNILPGRLLSLLQRDMIVVARVDCGVEMSVHLTLAARDSLDLAPGKQVWLIVKTHSCHLLASQPAEVNPTKA
jgi:molybdate transport system ATP-binding protein